MLFLYIISPRRALLANRGWPRRMAEPAYLGARGTVAAPEGRTAAGGVAVPATIATAAAAVASDRGSAKDTARSSAATNGEGVVAPASFGFLRARTPGRRRP